MGGLVIAVSGLPNGTAAAINVTGPDGFTRNVTRNQALAALVPGAYTVAAARVSAGNSTYAPTSDTQMLTVSAGDTPATASVAYVLAIGKLTVTISGLPAGATAAIEVTGPDFEQILTASTTLSTLAPGSYTVTASSVTIDTTLYNPSPAQQTVEVGAKSLPVTADVSYGQSATGMFNLAIDGMYVVQSTQTYSGTVPLVENRDALLRVFVLANRFNTERPAVRVRLYQDGTLFGTSIVPAPGSSVPTSVDQGDLNGSWNLVIPAAQVRAGLTIVADVDPDGTVAEGNESDNVFPVSGMPLALAIRPAPALQVRFVPIYQSVNARQGQVTTANRDQFLTAVLRMHPIVDVRTDVHEVYTTSAPALDATDDDAWSQVLSEVNALRVADPDAGRRHYYGVVNTSYTSGIAGLAYVGGRSAVGWDYLPSGANVAAHELGHNWGRYHAPCGAVSRPDLQYPYNGGSIGVYGFDFSTGTVKPPSSADIMSYCGFQWISDYTYVGVINYRGANPESATAAAPLVPSLLVWGRIVDGEPVLEPVFQIMARPSLPSRPGPYAVEGQAADGSTIFSLSFAPEEVADTRRGDQHFAFAVPLSASRASQLTSLRIASWRRMVTITAPAPGKARFRVGAAPGEAVVRRVAGSRVALRWDAGAHPMVMARDPASGRILGFVRGGNAEVMTDRGELELVASDRVQSQSVRVRVAP